AIRRIKRNMNSESAAQRDTMKRRLQFIIRRVPVSDGECLHLRSSAIKDCSYGVVCGCCWKSVRVSRSLKDRHGDIMHSDQLILICPGRNAHFGGSLCYFG